MSSSSCTRRAKIRVAVDILIGISVFVICGTLMARVRPTKRGFFCDDQSLSYPFRHDTVTVWQLLGTLLLAIPLLITLTELLWAIFRVRSSTKLRRSLHIQRDSDDVINGGKPDETKVSDDDDETLSSSVRTCCGRSSWSAATVVGLYLFGIAVTALITDVGKLTIGRHRPHFFDLCRPDFSKLNCSVGYVEEYSCTSGVHPWKLIEARKSFPSGHTSFAVYAAVFLAYYFRQRLVTDRTMLLKLVLDLCLCSMAVFTGLSRVIDNMHHWSDVFAGSVVGLAVAVWMIWFMQNSVTWDNFQPAEVTWDRSDHRPTTARNDKPCQVHSIDETNNQKNHSTQKL